VHKPALLKTSAAIAWGATIALSFHDLKDQADYRLWADIRTLAGFLTLAVMVDIMFTRFTAIYRAMMRSAISRLPYPAEDPGDPPTGPYPVYRMDRYRQPAQRATRG
jgi:hypothetical protein